MEQHQLVPYEMECMKMAMLKHEEIFKQQVYELHRLYRIQTMLMKQSNIPGRAEVPEANINPPRSYKNKLLRPSKDYCNKRPYKAADDDEAIDLTLGLGNFYCSKESSCNKPLMSPANNWLTSDDSVVMSFSSSSSGSSSSHPIKGVCPGELGRRDRDEYKDQRRSGRVDHRAMEQPPPWQLIQVLGLNI